MSQFVVGQLVECVDSEYYRHISNGCFYRVDSVLSDGDIRLDHVDAIYDATRFRPVTWEVGATYETTLPGVTAEFAAETLGMTLEEYLKNLAENGSRFRARQARAFALEMIAMQEQKKEPWK